MGMVDVKIKVFNVVGKIHVGGNGKRLRRDLNDVTNTRRDGGLVDA